MIVICKVSNQIALVLKCICPNIEIYLPNFCDCDLQKEEVSKARDLLEDGAPSAKGCCKPDRKDCTVLPALLH